MFLYDVASWLSTAAKRSEANPMRSLIWLVAAMLLAPVPGAGAENEADCLGVDFDAKQPIPVSTVSPGSPRVHYVKSHWEDADCPSAAEKCRSQAYLVPGDLVLTGRARGEWACISYQAPKAAKARWTNGWIPASRLKPVPRHPSPGLSGWLGAWKTRSARIEITRGEQGTLAVEGEALLQAAQSVHSGVLAADVKPGRDLIAFADDGSTPFESEKAGCRVRMQRVGAYLVVEDNGGCGGSMVTFTGFYRR
jgi:hypothetical protein